MRNQFLLDPDLVFLNHGSFGACPREVLDAQRRWQLEMERNPVEFLGRRSAELLFQARQALGPEDHIHHGLDSSGSGGLRGRTRERHRTGIRCSFAFPSKATTRQIGSGQSVDEVLADYPYLEREDILQALRYAAWRAEEREVTLTSA